MSTHSVREARKTLDLTFNNSTTTTLPSSMSKTLDVKQQITNKYKTFASWNYRQSLRKKRNSNSLKIQNKDKTNSNNMMNALMAYMQHLKQKDDKKTNKKKQIKVQQLQGVKDQRRQRLKKVQNPIQIIQHFMSKQNYHPTQQQNILLDRIIKLKQTINTVQPFDLQLVLTKCYKIMNISVDLNHMKFLIWTIMLTADICFEMKEFTRSLHFYTQAIIAATCTNMFEMKIQCFTKIGLICMDINEYEKATIFFKKALQYAWRCKDHENQLKLYDLIGQSYHVRGSNKYALYYHNRAIQGQYQSSSSAIKRISQQMLNQFDKTIMNSQKDNLSRLFIEYLDLPITNFFEIKPPQLKKVYENYIRDQSPRKNRQHKDYNIHHFNTIDVQLQNLLHNCPQFETQLPNPDIQRNFIAMHRFGKPRKEIDFQQSNQYHKLTGVNLEPYDKSLLKLPLDQQIDRAIADTHNPKWWSQMIIKMKKQKQQKIGSLRSRVWNTHKSHHKYPEQRKRANSFKQQKISESLNKTILNIIDPLKN